jgi:hypothetical protein
MPDTRILFMRHAEELGDPLDPHLSQEGAARAEKLADYMPETFGGPKFLFATAISKHSARPVETVTPLSQRVGVPINSSFADQDYGALAALLLNSAEYVGQLTIVCWHHGNIPPLMHALNARDGDYPEPWDSDVFNLILEATYSSGPTPNIRSVIEPF